MAVRFVLGGSGSGKSTYVRNEAYRLSKESRKNNVLLIVPDQFTMQTQWETATGNEEGGILNIDVLSFSRLPNKIFEEVGRPERLILDDTGKCLLVKRAASKVRNDLHVLSRGMDNPGWPEAVKSTLSEFMQYSISPKDLDRLIENSDDNAVLAAKLSDLKLLYEGFIKECSDKYITGEEMLDLLSTRISLSKKLVGSYVFFDGFTGFTPVQVKVIGEIARLAQDVVITLPFDSDSNEFGIDKDDILFELSRQNMRYIRQRLPKEIMVKDELVLRGNRRHREDSSLYIIEKNLFRPNPVRNYPLKDDCVRIVRCADIDHECHIVCSEILSLIKTRGYRYRDIAIICGDMGKYEKSLSKYFAKYSIPAFMDANRNISNDPLVKYIISAVDVVKNGFATEDVFRFLRTGLVPFADEDIDKLENYVYAKGIKGIKKWSSQFTSHSRETSNFPETLEEINETRAGVFALFEPFLIEGGFRRRELKTWLCLLYDMMEKTDVSDIMDGFADEFERTGKISEAMEFKGVYGKILDLFDQLASLMGEEVYTSKELADILEVGFGEIRLGTLPQGVDSLHVGDMERTRLSNIKALLFIGVNDGNIPRTGGSGGILSLPEKESLLKDENVKLSPSPADKAYIEQLYLYMNVTKPTEYLYMSYATIDSKGDRLVPSYFISVIEGLFDGLKTKNRVSDYPKEALADYKEEICSLIWQYAAGTISDEDEEVLLEDMGIVRNSEGGNEWVDGIIQNAFSRYEGTVINPEIARNLYKDMMRVSISGLEKFAECPYAHFATYGLGLCEREEFAFGFVDIGNINHDILKETGIRLAENGEDFSTVAEDVLSQITKEATTELLNGKYKELIESDPVIKYYCVQVERIMQRTVKTIAKQLSVGKFKPEKYESRFEKTYELPEEQMNVILNGRIDRMDVYKDEATGKRYVKIMDYKSSLHTIKPDNIKAGLSLQLAIYMKSAVDLLKDKYEDVNPGAMLYYKIDDPFVSDCDNAEEEILKKLVPTGAVIEDDAVIDALDSEFKAPNDKSIAFEAKRDKNGNIGKGTVYPVEEFMELLNAAESKALENTSKIINGEASVRPIKLNSSNTSCTYCSLKGVCGFDPAIPGYVVGSADEKEEETE